MERQLQHYGNQLPLATAIVGFLARLASTAKQSVSEPSTGQGGGEGGRETVEGGSEEREVYTEQQVHKCMAVVCVYIHNNDIVCHFVCAGITYSAVTVRAQYPPSRHEGPTASPQGLNL